jgi:hypothetical protein
MDIKKKNKAEANCQKGAICPCPDPYSALTLRIKQKQTCLRQTIELFGLDGLCEDKDIQNLLNKIEMYKRIRSAIE